jgi:hypothetical protein
MKSLHRLLVAAHHGGFERRSTGQISRFEIGAHLDQQVEDVVTLPADHKVQWRLAMFESRHAPIQRVGIVLDQAANQIHSSRRDGREDVVSSASLEKKRQDVPPQVARATERGGPADHVAFMNVTVAVNIGAGVKEYTDHVDVPTSCGEMQRRGVVAGVTGRRHAGCGEHQ